VNSWLKLVAEYSDQESTATDDDSSSDEINSNEAQTFSVGGFIFW